MTSSPTPTSPELEELIGDFTELDDEIQEQTERLVALHDDILKHGGEVPYSFTLPMPLGPILASETDPKIQQTMLALIDVHRADTEGNRLADDVSLLEQWGVGGLAHLARAFAIFTATLFDEPQLLADNEAYLAWFRSEVIRQQAERDAEDDDEE